MGGPQYAEVNDRHSTKHQDTDAIQPALKQRKRAAPRCAN